MIRMDDGADYHTSTTTTAYCCRVGLICMDWPAQSPDLNVQVNAQRPRIRSLVSMTEMKASHSSSGRIYSILKYLLCTLHLRLSSTFGRRVIQLSISPLEKFGGVNSLLVGDFPFPKVRKQ